MQPHTYSSRHVIINYGEHEVKGTADGDFIVIAPHGEGTSKVVGADGSQARGIDPDQSATVTITVIQGSPSIEYFSNRYREDQETGDIKFKPLFIHDLTGQVKFHAPNCNVENRPTLSYAKGAPNGSMDIVIQTDDATTDFGS